MTSHINEIIGFLHRSRLVVKGLLGLPLTGEIDGRFLVVPPRLLTDKFGESTCLPTVLEIYVSREHQWPLDIGRKVDEIYFPTDPPIVFNVCFSCAKPSLLHGGDYANPKSHWFNVFFGYYEIDAPRPKWERPFGFRNASGMDIEFNDLLRIGKSDWNYFSNYIYGVPGDECKKHDQNPPSALYCNVINPQARIGQHDYVEAEVGGLDVVSGYVSGKDGKKLVNNNGLFSPLWRAAFGRPKKSKSFPTSFISTQMRFRFLARYEEDYDADLGCQAYKTFIYGGTTNMDYKGPVDNDAFLAAQMAAVRRVIEAKPFRKQAHPKKAAPWKR